MSTWKVFCPALVDHDATREPYVIVDADQLFISYGLLQFLVRETETIPFDTTLDAEKPKPKKKAPKPKSVCIRSFNAAAWLDVELIG